MILAALLLFSNAAPLSPVEIAKKASAAAVVIQVGNFNTSDSKGTGFEAKTTGSGCFVADNLVLTCAHLFDESVVGSEPIIFASNAVSRDFFLKVCYLNDQLDVAILSASLPASNKPNPLKISKRASFDAGEKVYTFGSPLGEEGTFSDGVISSVRSSGVAERIQFTAPISHGSSGSPLLTEEGEVIGVVVSTVREGQNLNFAATAKECIEICESFYAHNGQLYSEYLYNLRPIKIVRRGNAAPLMCDGYAITLYPGGYWVDDVDYRGSRLPVARLIEVEKILSTKTGEALWENLPDGKIRMSDIPADSLKSKPAAPTQSEGKHVGNRLKIESRVGEVSLDELFKDKAAK